MPDGERAGGVPGGNADPALTPRARPAGLLKGVLDFILRNSLLWAGAAMAFGILVLCVPVGWLGGNRWGGADENLKAAAVQLVISVAFAVVALVRIRFSERDRDRPSWLLALKAAGLFAFYFLLAVGGGVVLIAVPLGAFVMLLAVPALLIAGALAGRKGGTPKEISDRRARRIAPAIIFLALIFAVALPCLMPSTMARNESATIGWLYGFQDSLRGAGPTKEAFDEAAAGWPKLEDGSRAWFGFYFQVMDLPNFGGLCVVAHPTRYNRTGLNTFILAPDDTVWQRDLGWDPARRVKPESWDPVDPDKPWIVCE